MNISHFRNIYAAIPVSEQTADEVTRHVAKHIFCWGIYFWEEQFWGRGKCLHYYACRKMIAAKMMFVRFSGQSIIFFWGRAKLAPGSLDPVAISLQVTAVKLATSHRYYIMRHYTLPSHGATSPFLRVASIPSYTAWCQRGACMNDVLKGVTWQYKTYRATNQPTSPTP